MSAILSFDKASVQHLIDLTLANPSTQPPYRFGDPLEEPCLFLVKDHGIYLLPHYEGHFGAFEQEEIVYAQGYNPNTDGDVWDKCRAAAGGDDFAEALPCADFQAIIDHTEGDLIRLKATSTAFLFLQDTRPSP